MTKDLADRDQPGAVAQQLAGQGVAQAVRPHRGQPGSDAGPLDDVTDQVRPYRSARGPAGQEQGRPPSGQRSTQRPPDR